MFSTLISFGAQSVKCMVALNVTQVRESLAKRSAKKMYVKFGRKSELNYQ